MNKQKINVNIEFSQSRWSGVQKTKVHKLLGKHKSSLTTFSPETWRRLSYDMHAMRVYIYIIR